MLVAAFVVTLNSFAQDGKILTGFAPTYSSSSIRITKMLELPDGSIIYANYAPGPLDYPVSDLVKVSSTGVVDTSFNYSAMYSSVTALCLQPDGKILVGGQFGVIRVNTDGSIDTTFTNPTPMETYAIVIQPVTGKILVGNRNTSNNKGLNRLNSDGSIDTTFNPAGSGIPFGWFGSYVNDIETLSDGSMIITGTFSNYNDGFQISTSRSGIAKINANGTLHPMTFTAFTSNIAFDSAIQADGKIVVVGGDNTGSTVPQIVRFNTDGTVDTTYTPPMPGAGVTSHTVTVIEKQGGKMIISGNFQNFGGTARSSIARLNFDGTLDTCFDPGYGLSHNAATGVGEGLDVLISEIDGNAYVCGDFTYYDGTARSNIAKLRTVTTVNAVDDFPPAVSQGVTSVAVSNVLDYGTDDTVLGVSATTLTVTLSLESSDHAGITLNTTTGAVNVASTVPAGSYSLIYKICQTVSGVCNCDTARVQVNVANTSIRANALVNRSGVQSDNKIIIAGYFTAYNSIPTFRIAKLNTNLTLDPTFNGSGPSPAAQVAYDMAIQPDDKIILVGNFDGWSGGSNGRCITRLLPNGNNDTSFNAGGAGAINSSGNQSIYAVALQTDGKILVGGNFQAFNGTGRNFIARLNANGTVDTSFAINAGFNTAVTGIAVQADGKIVVAGHFTTYQGTPAPNIIRLNPNGTIDTAFLANVGTGFAGGVVDVLSKDVYMQPDGKILVIGTFTSFNGVAKNYIVRLNTNGTLDTTFVVGTAFNDRTRSIAIDPSAAKIYVGGDFATYNGASVPTMVRLNANGSLDTTFSIGSGPAGPVYTLTRQPDAKIIVGGQFTTFSGISAANVTRIIPSTGAQGRGIDMFVSEPEIDINAGNITNTDIMVIANPKVSIYPNPSTGIFTLDMKGYEGQTFELVIHNALGQLVHQTTLKPENAYQIDLTNFQNGNYFVRLQNNSTTINKIISKQ